MSSRSGSATRNSRKDSVALVGPVRGFPRKTPRQRPSRGSIAGPSPISHAIRSIRSPGHRFPEGVAQETVGQVPRGGIGLAALPSIADSRGNGAPPRESHNTAIDRSKPACASMAISPSGIGVGPIAPGPDFVHGAEKAFGVFDGDAGRLREPFLPGLRPRLPQVVQRLRQVGRERVPVRRRAPAGGSFALDFLERHCRCRLRDGPVSPPVAIVQPPAPRARGKKSRHRRNGRARVRAVPRPPTRRSGRRYPRGIHRAMSASFWA